jgi:hypothetical protein
LSKAVDSGIHCVEVGVGGRLCGLYAGSRQRDEMLMPFLAAVRRPPDRVSGAGEVLDATLTIVGAGLGNGDIVTVGAGV